MRPRMVPEAPPQPPTESWWLGKDRDAFYAEVRQREAALSSTRFGRLWQLSTASSVTSEDDGRWRKARREDVA